LKHNIEAGRQGAQSLEDKLIVVGGAAHSDLWMQIIADITGYPVYTIEQEVEAAMGAALLAAMLAVALYQTRALPLLHAAGLVTAMIYLGIIPPTSIGSDIVGGSLGVDGQPVVVSDQLTRNIGV
ncbi:FGGY-family carbohydrate kinase, partial [Mesorhizobium sp. M3A.F.Ca.ET.174.01.1.1]|uniref:FGGY-family carbohydrate kinase n=1 Tax=Mesorhizobium sp. M3A.F.Ca.ET.174.01.1.1 TaxID=2563944 RepID=UPI001AEEC9B2